MSYKLFKINEYLIPNINQNTVKGFWCHKNKGTPTSDYLSKAKNIIDNTNLDYVKYNFMLNSCEERIFNMINRNPIEIQEIEKTYRKIIDDEIKQKII
jgi:hypothetical protein